ncbi:hypothetical protein PR202_ga03351 [Eleusine coracana subsp. coracana]|uniref:Acyl-CoA-binding domain-containing protein n=1 Tax=Eleusine coracana subsp. coracana TaxID=191504 RepID=A0AAV5BN62_ELECO|nr:hypothetical protein PR202_ga03351 [Eleusine coracana subsp. coracana]
MGEGISGEVGLAAAPYDQWLLLSPADGSPRPSARYKHAAEVVQDKLFVVGGSRNGRSLSDVQVFDFKTFMWSALIPTRDQNHLNHENNDTDQPFPALPGHSLVKWKNNLVVIAGNIRSQSALNKVSVWLIDVETNSWSALDTYGKVPDHKRRLLNDLHILDLETMMWEEVKTAKGGPAARYDHSAALYADQYLLIFGGSSHSTCFNDLYLLDLQTMEWSRPDTQGAHISPRSGHAGTMIDENWYIVGGGDNASGSTDTIVMNGSKFVWSVVTSVSAWDPLACEGLTLCSATVDGEKFLIAFGGYNGKYNNEVLTSKSFVFSFFLLKELKSVQDQLAAEGSRCQKLEIHIAAARKRLESASSLENELDVLRQQISQVEQTMSTAQRQKSGGVWKWVAGSAEVSDDE